MRFLKRRNGQFYSLIIILLVAAAVLGGFLEK